MEANTEKTQKQTENVIEKENKIVTGVIWQQLLLFFFPILFGTFFQQLYNAADAVIVVFCAHRKKAHAPLHLLYRIRKALQSRFFHLTFRRGYAMIALV